MSPGHAERRPVGSGAQRQQLDSASVAPTDDKSAAPRPRSRYGGRCAGYCGAYGVPERVSAAELGTCCALPGRAPVTTDERRPIHRDNARELAFREWQAEVADRHVAALRCEPIDGRDGGDVERRDPLRRHVDDGPSCFALTAAELNAEVAPCLAHGWDSAEIRARFVDPASVTW